MYRTMINIACHKAMVLSICKRNEKQKRHKDVYLPSLRGQIKIHRRIWNCQIAIYKSIYFHFRRIYVSVKKL